VTRCKLLCPRARNASWPPVTRAPTPFVLEMTLVIDASPSESLAYLPQ